MAKLDIGTIRCNYFVIDYNCFYFVDILIHQSPNQP